MEVAQIPTGVAASSPRKLIGFRPLPAKFPRISRQLPRLYYTRSPIYMTEDT